MISLTTLLFVSIAYLGLIYLSAVLIEKSSWRKKIIDSPITYVLSLGAYASIWAVFGVTEIANQQGYLYIAYYFGGSLLFIFAPLILQPIASISQSQRLNSLADLFSYRYNSQWAGIFVTLGTLLITLPLLSWQMSIANNVANFLSQTPHAEANSQLPALLLCFFTAVFAIHFGGKKHQFHDKHDALVFVSAFQSLIKLVILLALGFIAVFYIFSSPVELEQWLATQPTTMAILSESLDDVNIRTLILIFTVAALVMPHSYHLIFTENRNHQALLSASWAFPLYLLLLSLPIFPILWAVKSSGHEGAVLLYPALIGTILQSPTLTLLAWVAGLAAASSAIIAILIAVASMCSNHLVLPFFANQQKQHSLFQLGLIRSLIIILLTGTAFLLHSQFFNHVSFKYFYYAAYIAIFQFLPGILATLYWPKGNRNGLLAGLTTGFAFWLITIAFPISLPQSLIPNWLAQLFFSLGNDYWALSALYSLALNTLVFAVVSWLTQSDEEEMTAAKNCAQNKIDLPNRFHLALNNVPSFIDNLSKAIGTEIAQREVQQALKMLNMNHEETRPFALRLLRRQIEVNLSGLFGSTVARQIVNQHLPYVKGAPSAGIHDIQLIEHRLEKTPLALTGIAQQLDKLRLYHRNTLEQLPIGVCTLSNTGEILMWNKAMQALTGIATHDIIGSKLSALAEPWQTVFCQFSQNQENSSYHQSIAIDQEVRWFNLRKANALNTSSQLNNHTFLIEETTERVKLEQELLHSERLASIGRLAAGVAHEIGNPVTGIACLAQNLKYDSDQPEITEAAKDIIAQTQRITRIIQSLVNFSHSGSNRLEFTPTQVNLFDCANEAIHLLSLNKDLPVQLINNAIDNPLYVQGDTQLLQQMFINLLTNALDVIDPIQGSITLSNQQNNNAVTLCIDDNGPGIPTGLHNQIFEPFFTTKEAGHGTGLGLALVYGIIEEHNGHIQLQSPNPATANGSRFIIQFPTQIDAL